LRTRKPVLGQEEGLVRTADNLLGLVALEAPSARVPGDDRAVRRDHVDRIIDDGIDEELETLLLEVRDGLSHDTPATPEVAPATLPAAAGHRRSGVSDGFNTNSVPGCGS
jgi:hypothetical protein